MTENQVNDARQNLQVSECIPLPGDLQQLWGNIPPELEGLANYLEPFRAWLSENVANNDFVLIQGDFGACHLLIEFSFENGFIPIYSTTKREAVEEKQPDGSVKMSHRISHVRFRKYGK